MREDVTKRQPEMAEHSVLPGGKQTATDETEKMAHDNKHLQFSPHECDFDTDPSALYTCIQRKKWDDTILLSEEDPEEAMTWVSRKEKDGRLRWRLLPLHAAVIFKAPERVVEALLCAYPKGAQCPDDQGMLPIHLAFRHGSNEDVVNLLLVAYPQSIDVKDRKGRIPLELAQASTSPNKDAFVRALQRGPTYYAVAAAATERAAVTAEQRAIFEAKLIQVRNNHQHEMDNLKKELEVSKLSHQRQVVSLEEELAKTQETSQVLVDHVSSLEAQLSSRSDTERFLATKIATLDSTLKGTNKDREDLEVKLQADLEKVDHEKEELQEKIQELQLQETEGQKKLAETEEKLAETEKQLADSTAESEAKHRKQDEALKNLEADLILARNTADSLEASLQSKKNIEETLATQVSTLASRLAQKAADASQQNNAYERRLAQGAAERAELRKTVVHLTRKLADVAKTLEAMTADQERIVKAAAEHEKTMTECTQVQQDILENSRRQDEIRQKAQEGHEALVEMIRLQEEYTANAQMDSDKLVAKAEALRDQMISARKNREELVCAVVNQRLEMRDMVHASLNVLPREAMNEDNLVDQVVKTTLESTKNVTAESEDQEYVPSGILPELPEPEASEEADAKEGGENVESDVVSDVVEVEEDEHPSSQEEETEIIEELKEQQPAPQEVEPSAIEEHATPEEESATAEEVNEQPETQEVDSATPEEPGSEESVASKGTSGTDDITSGEEEPFDVQRSQHKPAAEDRVMASRSFN